MQIFGNGAQPKRSRSHSQTSSHINRSRGGDRDRQVNVSSHERTNFTQTAECTRTHMHRSSTGPPPSPFAATHLAIQHSLGHLTNEAVALTIHPANYANPLLLRAGSGKKVEQPNEAYRPSRPSRPRRPRSHSQTSSNFNDDRNQGRNRNPSSGHGGGRSNRQVKLASPQNVHANPPCKSHGAIQKEVITFTHFADPLLFHADYGAGGADGAGPAGRDG